jgi:hypothetical protein
MSYVDPEPSPSRRVRRRRAMVTLAVVAALLFGSFWYAYSYYRADSQAKASEAPTCPRPTAAPKGPAPADVSVNVYNATSRTGLAARTATELRKRGFKVATVANDPLRADVRGVAQVRHGPGGTAGAAVVLPLVKGAARVQDSRTDATVDLVLGERFTALAPAPAQPTTSTPPPAQTPSAARTSAPATPGC